MDTELGTHRKVKVQDDGGGYSREKRRFSEGFPYENDYTRRTKPGELSTPRPRPPRLPANMVESKVKPEMPPEVMQAKQLLVAVADYSSLSGTEEVVGNLRGLADALVEGGDLVSFSAEISDVFVQCFSELTMQIPALTTLLWLIGKSTDGIFVELVVEKLVLNFFMKLETNDIPTAKLNLRALCCLGSAGAIRILGENSLAGIFKILAAELKSGLEQSTREYIQSLTASARVTAFLIASSVPWTVSKLLDSGSDGIELLDTIQNLLSAVRLQYRSPYDVGGSHCVFQSSITAATSDGDAENGFAPSDAACWDDLWSAVSVAETVIREAKSGIFEAPAIMPMPWLLVDSSYASNSDEPEGVGLKMGQLQLPVITTDAAQRALSGCAGGSVTQGPNVPLEGVVGRSSTWLGLRFSLFDRESAPNAESLLALSALERHVLYDIYADVIRVFEPFVEMDGTLLGSMEMMCRQVIAVNKLFPNTVRTEFALVEILLLQLIQIPPKRPIVVMRLLLELCRTVPEMPPALATGATLLFQLCPVLDTSSIRELSKWHSGHLLNSELAWPYWDYFGTEFEEAGSGDGRRYYLTMLVDNLARCTLTSKVKKVLPLPLQPLINILAWSPNRSIFDPEIVLDESSVDYSSYLAKRALAQELKSRVERRQNPDDLQDWLEGTHNGIDDSTQTPSWRLTLLFHAIIVVGMKSSAISALASLLDRYGELLRNMSQTLNPEPGSENANSHQQEILDFCLSTVGHDLGTLFIVLDHLLRRGIVLPSIVASWTCRGESGSSGASGSLISRLDSEPWAWSLLELPVTRAIDGFENVLSRTKALMAKKASETDIPMQIIGLPEPEDEGFEANNDDEDSRRARLNTAQDSSHNHDAIEMTDAEATDADNSVDMDALVVAAAAECRSVYETIVDSLVQTLIKKCDDLQFSGTNTEEIEVDSLVLALCSMIRQMGRVFYGTQFALTAAYSDILKEDSVTPIRIVGSAIDLVNGVETNRLPTSIVKAWGIYASSYNK